MTEIAQTYLKPCSLCQRIPQRNGRVGVGGVICQSPGHLVQIYGSSQTDADRKWNEAFARHREQADRETVQKIVAWLSEPEWPYRNDALIAAIKAGEHLK